MKKCLILLVMSVLFACNSQAGYVLKGVFKGAGNGNAILTMHAKGGLVICDTVKMKGGKFVFEGEVPCVGFALVTVAPEGKEAVQMRVALENSKIEMRGDWRNVGINEEEELVIKGMTVTGSKNNDVNEEINKQWYVVEAMPEFKKYAELAKMVFDAPETLEDTTFYWVYRKEFDAYMARVKEEQLKIMAANPSVETAAYNLNFMMNEMSLEQLEQVFGLFDEKVRESELVKEVRDCIELRQRIEPGRPAPEFTLARRDGSLLSLSDFRGKVVVLDFWASWCKPCRASFPWVREFYKEYKDKGVEIVGVSIDKNRASWEKALDEEQLPWPQVIDEWVKDTYRVGGLFYVRAVPMFVIVDKEGKIVVRAHMESKEELSAVVEKALKK
ncbi:MULTISPECIES: TlpA disulfide reductase family protein [Butyricimonas]|uniref:TlpA disulfide reductase family protein n=1 Tax=Butyricimonas TaxID=574697 RepID=UPI001D064EDC|nr:MULTISPECIES: TlpA disulfide reductase family protein [Butyricimonas]MCB6971731.1 AhpC/TSA family protein [Butyricimonas synergistica]MCG4518662.1 AhpC/TSA family protein [Butyricimonas sp. DFI.6.44]